MSRYGFRNDQYYKGYDRDNATGAIIKDERIPSCTSARHQPQPPKPLPHHLRGTPPFFRKRLQLVKMLRVCSARKLSRHDNAADLHGCSRILRTNMTDTSCIEADV